MNRITIAVSSLSKENWIIIYSFIKSILRNTDLDSKIKAYSKILEIAKTCLEKGLPDEPHYDVYKLDNNNDYKPDLGHLGKDTVFSLIFIKQDQGEDFTQLVPFLLLQEEFGNCISLGIDILNVKEQDDYAFKCRSFFILYNDIKPIHGFKSIYFINVKNKKYKEISYTTALHREGVKKYEGKSSRRFLPLIFISHENYRSIFGTYKKKNNIQESKTEQTSEKKELVILKDSINKMLADFDEETLMKLKLNTDLEADQSESFFGQWLECGYFYSYDKDEKKQLKTIKIEEIKKTIQIIKNNIFELVQNIIFHAGEKGLLYCVFDKKNNIPESFYKDIPDFNKYDNSFRFLRIGIFDFSDKGIVDTFTANEHIEEKEHLSLTDFFDLDSIVTTKLSRPHMRYAARLGIKTFVKAIIRHKGFLSVETNVSNSKRGNKKNIQTVSDGGVVKLNAEKDYYYANGTHYEIVFPVMPYERNTKSIIPVQRVSMLANFFEESLHLLYTDKPIQSLALPRESIEKIATSDNKEDQNNNIIEIGNAIISEKGDKNVIAFDLNNHLYDYNILFKILSYIQLKSTNGFEKIILINSSDDIMDYFCDFIEKVTNDEQDYIIWSKDSAIILINDNLRAQIIWGASLDEYEYINSEFLIYYCFNFFAINHSNNKFSEKDYKLDKDAENKAKSFILPYDIIINTIQKQSLFEQFLSHLLSKKIISEELGFMVNHENTYIGNKIIVRNYYEADMMFQNNFFTERFAFLISNNLKLAIKENRKKETLKSNNLVLIGHKHYSELLLKTIKRFLKDYNIYLAIFNDENEDNDISNYFNFDIDGNGWKIKNRILSSPDSYYYATIVPIGSTLSTNDKLIAFFKYWIEKESHKANSCKFIYNHCVIVVRDTIQDNSSLQEIKQNWKKLEGIDTVNHIIYTEFINAKEVHYTVQVAQSIEDKDNDTISEYDNWLRRLNDAISFPKEKWWNEKYVNYTENSSINSQNLMGFPRAEIMKEVYHYNELERLYKLKNYIIKGHINVLNCYHKFYLDTESFVRRENTEISKWLSEIKDDVIDNIKHNYNQKKLNILITPSAERESDLIYAVNNSIFSNNALIVYLDINNWRNNIIYKLSFLKDLPQHSISYHYVDQAMLSGETYRKTKSYLFSILGSKRPVHFSSIIIIVNRLPYTKNLEIKIDVNNRLFSYVNLHYPSIKMDEQKSDLEKLDDYYKWLSSRTVIDSCLGIINKNQTKLKIIHKDNIEPNSNKLSKRNFLRLVMTHELFYIISGLANKENNNNNYYKNVSEKIIKELNSIYTKLSDSRFDGTKSINNFINIWFDDNAFKIDRALNDYYNKKLIIDKKITFLKVISSPPLSRYIIIRQYAHEKLLNELNFIINKKTCDYDDLKVVKSILKSLSFLKSNALVRKAVIIGVWKVLGHVIDHLDEEKKEIEKIVSVSIKSIINDFESNNMLSHNNLFSRQINLAKDFKEELDHDLLLMNKESLIKDFSRDFQFFIKNAIVEDEAKATFLGELIRRGDELTEFDNIMIGNTILSYRNKKPYNSLFKAFKDNISLEKEYINFLVLLFYDNTTIIRKTLENFSKEIIKDEKLFKYFYKKNNNELILSNNNVIINNFKDIKDIFEEKVKNEYYYSSFKPYLHNQDDIKFVDNLIYVSFAKLKLEDILNNKNKKGIETDTKELMELFVKIMSADAAFWTMKKEDATINDSATKYVISQFGLNDKHDGIPNGKIEIGFLKEEFYTNSVIDEPSKYPIVPKFNLQINHGEKKSLKMDSLCVFLISNNDETTNICNRSLDIKSKEIVASITFLYNNENKLTKDVNKFRVNIQESGRLMLLLKNEIEQYVIGYLLKDKAFDLWEQKYRSVKRFEKIYANSSHIFKSVDHEMNEFELLKKEEIYKLSDTWYFLTNETISYLYSDIERNSDNSRHYLDLETDYIISRDNTLGKTFNDNYIYILSVLLEKRWKKELSYKGEIIKNQIFVNGQDINHFKIGDDLNEVKISCKKNIIRTFVAQCLHNSLSSINGEHGHRGNSEIKRINLTISPTSIIIEDISLNDYYSVDIKKERSERFKKKKKFIKDMRCDDYSSTTLTSLQGLVNYMCKNKINYSCDFGFNPSNNFILIINFS